jgi:hypothetical protein
LFRVKRDGPFLTGNALERHVDVTCPSGEPHLFAGWVGLDDGTAGVPIAEARPWQGFDAGRRVGRP